MPVPVLFISRSGNLAGSERQLALILKGLDRSLYTPLVLCPGDGPFVDLLREAGEQVLLVAALTGIRKLTFPLLQLPGILHRHRIALLHLCATRFCSLGARCAGVPVIEAITMSRNIPQAFASRSALVDRFFSRLPKRLLVPSRHLADELIARGVPAAKITVLYNAVWPTLHTWAEAPDRGGVRSALGIPENAILAGVFGRLEQQKGIEDFISAAGMLAEDFPNLFFVICGDGSLAGVLHAQIERSGLLDRVFMPGFQQDIYRWLTALDISVSSSVWEPLSNHVIESMHAGLPIIATDVGGTSEAVIDNMSGLLIPPRAPVRMAEAIRRLISTPDLRTRLGANARKQAEKQFSAAQMAATVEATYCSVLEGSRG